MSDQNLTNEFDSIGASTNDAADSSAVITDNIQTDPIVSDADNGDAKAADVSQELIESFDSLGTADEKALPAVIKAPTKETDNANADDSASSLLPDADADTSKTADIDSQGKTDTADKAVDAQKTEKEGEGDKAKADASETNSDAKADDADLSKEDWEAPPAPETEDYIKKLPKPERERARAFEKDARMLKSYLNPLCPPEQWISNAKEKSQMRFDAISEAILQEKNAVSLETVKTDPVKFLGEIFEKTSDGENSETYQNLLDTAVKTNQEYIVHALEADGKFKVVPVEELSSAVKAKGTTDLTGSSDIANMSDDEIEEFKQSEAFERLSEVYPEDAERLQKLLDEAREGREARAKLQTKETEEEAKARVEAENKAKTDADEAQKAQIAAQKQTIETFETVYNENVTNPVLAKLDNDFGLAVSDKERATDPTMAFLKEAKKRLILAGGLDGSGDFDNDLKEWGDSRPAFKQAASALVEYTRAGERKNAEAAAASMRPFADSFLNERLNLPEIKMIDEIIQEVVFARSVKNRTREDNVPDSLGAAAASNSKRSIVDEFDSIK